MYEYCFTLNIHTTAGLTDAQVAACNTALMEALERNYPKPDGSGQFTNGKADMDDVAGEHVTVLIQPLTFVGIAVPDGDATIPGDVTDFIQN